MIMIPFRPVLATLLTALMSLQIFAADGPENDATVAAIKKHAEACADAQRKLEFDKLIPYVPAKLLEFMGGVEGLTETMNEQMAEMKRREVTIESVKIGTPETPKDYDGLLAGLVPQEIILNSPQGKIATKTYLIAVSENKGGSWVFIDCIAINEQKLGILYPSLKGKLEIPKTEAKLAE